ncbi:gliding motility-associated-like protein [Leeuwenhoekiella aestuarii]|uniref:Gliding motility-associated-like protein n=1 Tax=Leeuwenhoekiella aestuarii TaxID=2249426 RepID=A0A4Q0NQ02_9FLAO|nr:gliding motility-associated C-terminal domain-containing protein [Leeuwenhoekiella aestuarii]RXG11721.1 gliding motility-associated-like protein [Leeuwenhoekiella aestuarii]RXG12776.1 gliding motility-associated-like protein [Leeuwenhoekiella aestuarii]
MNFLRPLIKLFGFLLVVFYGTDAVSQTTPIPDTNFEQDLITQGYDTNGLNGNILNTDAAAFTNYSTGRNDIIDFTGLEAFVNLVTLNAGTNQFATLPLTTLTLLEELVFDQNMALASLDLSGNPNLKIFQARANGGSNTAPITVIDLSNNLQLEDINIYNFRNLQQVIFPDTDTVVSIYLLMHNDITVDFSGYSSLESLALSTNFNNSFPITATLPSEQNVLRSVAFQGGNIINVDLSNFLALEFISLQSTNTETIDIPQTTALTTIRISGHKIASASFADASMLQNLDITRKIDPPGLILDLTQNQALTALNASSNYMNAIDLSQNTVLKNLNLSNNDFISFDISQNIALEDLNASNNAITNLDLSTNTLLKAINLNNNELPTLDLSTNLELERLNLSRNLLPTLDVTNNTKLRSLSINDNLFTDTGLDLTQNPELDYLNASNNQIESLDITQNVKLGSLILHHNLFSGTDIMDQYYAIWSANGALGASDDLDVSNNLLTGKIPDFASLALDRRTNYFELKFNDNYFHFGDFEEQHLDYVALLTTFWSTNSSLRLFREYRYAPQAKVNAVENLTHNAGEDIVLTTVVRGSQNHYKWFKDGVAIPDAPDSPNLVLDDLNSCDAGVYYSEITSDLVPFENSNPPGTNGKNLLLVRNDITLDVNYTQECTSLTAPADGSSNIPRNPRLEWEDRSGACGYRITVGTTNGGSEILDKVDVGEDPFYALTSNLPANTQIFVRITPYYAGGAESNTCTVTDFTTGTAVLNRPACAPIMNPLPGSIDATVNTTIDWDASTGATGYSLSLGTYPGGTDLLAKTDLGNTLTYTHPTALPYDTVIYVNLTPYNSDGEAVGCPERSFRTEKLVNTPSCTTLINPTAGAINVPLDTDLSWNASAAATGYFLSVGTTSGGSEILNKLNIGNVTSYDLTSDLPENTEIFVSIIPYNSAANATGCTEESFTTETLLTPPECTTLSSPLDGATDVAIDTNLNWNASATATGYFLNAGTTSGGKDILNNLDVGNVTSYDLTSDLPENTEIFVSITPYNSAGNATGCTEESFTTETLLTPPACTTLSSPLAGATDVVVDTDLSWNASASATGYFLSVGTTSSGSEILNNLDVGNTTTHDLTSDLSENTEIIVSITPYNSAGNATGCTEESFTTETLLTPPECITLSSPLAGATDVVVDTDLSWNASASATGYFLSVGTTSSGSEILNNLDVGNTTTHDLTSDLSENTVIFVSIIPYNSAGNATGCTEESFTTETLLTPPACTTLSSPLDGATDVSVDTDLSWNASATATKYFLSVGTTIAGGEILDNLDVGNKTTHDLTSDLPENTVIFVSITPYNSAGNATGCAEKSFTTGSATPPPLPSCTTLTNPGPGSTGAFITATISWERVDFATGYLISMGLETQATSYVENRDIGNSDTFFLGEALPYNTDVYVKIVPYNSTGEAQGCMIQTFRTRPDPNTPDEFNCTQITSPQDGATAVATTTSLTWDAVPDAVSYLLTVGTTSGGGEIFNLLNVGSDTSFTFIDELEPNTTYYVTVTPGYGSGSATDCPEIRFTTAQTTGTVTKAPKSRYGISPDGDGINEFWRIEDLDQYPNNTVSVFNRWGDLVFETKDYDNSLNVFRGEANQKTGMGAGKLPEGTYFFMITSDNPELTEPVKGFIVLKR